MGLFQNLTMRVPQQRRIERTVVLPAGIFINTKSNKTKLYCQFTYKPTRDTI